MIRYLKDYSRFSTISEMDAAAEQHFAHHWDELTKSDRQVLDVIRCYPQLAWVFQRCAGEVGG